MPYGGRTYSRTRNTSSRVRFTRNDQKSARAKAVAKARGPVKRIQKKSFVPQQLKNTQSISSLSRAVRNLQRAQLGPFQTQWQQLRLDHDAGIPFKRAQPIVFQVNDFTDQQKIWQPDASTHVAAALSKKFNVIPSTWFQGADAHFDPHWAMRDDTVSHTRYHAVSTTLEWKFGMKLNTTDTPRWVRIDFITPKKILPNSSSHTLNLPEGAYSLSNLLNWPKYDAPEKENHINPLYWKKVAKTQWVKFSPHLSSTDVDVIRHLKTYLKFNQTINCEIDTPYTTTDSVVTNTARKSQVWCVINFDTDYAAADHFGLSINRRISWRDEHGVAA